MTSGINDELTNMQTWTAMQQQAAQQLNKGSDNELNQDMFLKLMLEQLKYQDPLNPMSNQEFLAQQAQFTQLTELQKLNSNTLSNNTVQQCVALIGKEVTLVDPDDTSKTITGVVTEAVFDSNGSSIKIGDKTYPLGLVTQIREAKTETAAETGETPTANTTEATSDTTETTAESGSSMLDSISGIAKTLDYIAAKIANYL